MNSKKKLALDDNDARPEQVRARLVRDSVAVAWLRNNGPGAKPDCAPRQQNAGAGWVLRTANGSSAGEEAGTERYQRGGLTLDGLRAYASLDRRRRRAPPGRSAAERRRPCTRGPTKGLQRARTSFRADIESCARPHSRNNALISELNPCFRIATGRRRICNPAIRRNCTVGWMGRWRSRIAPVRSMLKLPIAYGAARS